MDNSAMILVSIIGDSISTFEHYNDMVAKSIGDDTNYKQLLILPFDN